MGLRLRCAGSAATAVLAAGCVGAPATLDRGGAGEATRVVQVGPQLTCAELVRGRPPLLQRAIDLVHALEYDARDAARADRLAGSLRHVAVRAEPALAPLVLSHARTLERLADDLAGGGEPSRAGLARMRTAGVGIVHRCHDRW